eukprot:1473015-Alexandrium_andersonii.AAC.1
MSASLVGSEMCIRDRLHLVLPVSEATPPLRCGVRLVSWGCRPPDAPPVSYTHLTLPTICSV